MKTVVVLPGGGANGGVHAGALAELEEAGITFDHAVGTSAGSINAAGLMRRGGVWLERMWLDLDASDVHRQWSARSLLSRILSAGLADVSLYDSSPLAQLLERELPGETKGATAVLVDLISGGVQYDAAWPASILASCAIPGVYPPVGGVLIDGGVRKMAPLGHAMRLQPDRIILIHSRKPGLAVERRPRSIVDVLLRSMEIAMDENLVASMQEHRRHNVAVRHCLAHGIPAPPRDDGTPYRYVQLIEVVPDEVTAPSSDFSRAANRERVRVGRAAARRAIEQYELAAAVHTTT